MTEKKIAEVQEALLKIRNLQLIPEKRREPPQNLEYSACLAIIRANQHEFFKTLTHNPFQQLRSKFCMDDKGVVSVNLDSASTFYDILYGCKPPIIKEEYTSAEEINKTIAELNEGSDSVYGGWMELNPILVAYEETLKYTGNIFKALSLSNELWSAEAMFDVMLPPDIERNYVELKSLVSGYKALVERYNSCYEKLSRTVSVREAFQVDSINRGSVNPSEGFSKPSWKK